MRIISKKIKNFLRYIIPPILLPGNMREIFNALIHKDKTIHHFEFEDKFYSRQAFINKAISKFEDCKYLEIGVYNNLVFNSIPLKIENKFGVDPEKGGNYRMTSDEFFNQNEQLKFNVIFIDGLHDYKQCQKDCLNSMKQLDKNGIIFLHDLLPRSFFEEKLPRRQSKWTGDVWKVAVELANSKNVEFRIINIDHGIGVLKLKENFYYQKIDNLVNENFNEYLKHRKKLPIITSEEGLDFISNNS